ncbi:29088_t:CDS:2 [Gigaspora margarita]|uniref:29088_t:CDS:1 n=1 Tax=Gigaspora margarita TaxID=4874 RepID=A0ABN7VX27_GIGMA|nr:29088_t:CDS:2 [Gigaspora margarita]
MISCTRYIFHSLNKNFLCNNIFIRQIKTPANFQPSPINDTDEILETHYIPGRYLHFIKKNKRQLKKEAREALGVGSKPVLRISARKSEYSKIEEETHNTIDVSTTTSTTLSFTQRNLVQRLNRAIIKCNDQVPHMYLTSTFMKVTNITISSDSKFARIWWKPEGQKGISKAAIEQQLCINLVQYRTMLQRSMRVRKPPKILFCREDLQLGDINKILDQIESENKINMD